MSSAAVPGAPQATRASRPGWRDPRIIIGFVLVAASVVASARLLSAADDTVPVWAVRRDLPAGTRLEAAMLEPRRVRFADASTADSYVSAHDAAPAGELLGRSVGEGELLPRAALDRDPSRSLIEVPLSVDVDNLPATVRAGAVVDVWVAPAADATHERRPRATLVLDDVSVVRVAGAGTSLSPQATRQVIVGLPAEQSEELGDALGRIVTERVVITRQGHQ